MKIWQALKNKFYQLRGKNGKRVLRKVIAVTVLVAFMISTMNMGSIPQALGAEVTTANAETSINNTEESNQANNSWLIIDDRYWSHYIVSIPDELTLKELGIPFNVISGRQLADWDLEVNPPKVVFIASDQLQDTYNYLFDNTEKLDNYVYNGGVLLVHGADNGDPYGQWENIGEGYGEWADQSFIPGGLNHTDVRMGLNYWSGDSSSPILEGIDPRGLSWAWPVWGYFTDIPAWAKTIVSDYNRYFPVYVEYTWGAGTVLASGLHIESGYTSGYPDALKFVSNEFSYANSIAEPVPTVKITGPQNNAVVSGQVSVTAKGTNVDAMLITVSDTSTGMVVFEEAAYQTENTWV